MRIGIDARFYGSIGKGLGRYTQKLIQELEKLPGDDQFIVFLRRENFDKYQPANYRFTKVLADFPWYGWREQLFFPCLLYRYNIDLMHFPHFNFPLFYWKKSVVTIHDLILFHYPTVKASELSPLLYWVKYWVYRFVIFMAVLRAVKVIAVSQFTAHDLLGAFPFTKKKIIVTYEAAESYCFWNTKEYAREFLQSLNLHTREYVLYVGNAYPHKNLRCLFDIAKLFPDKKFVCVGKEDYFYRTIQQQTQELEINNICFIGFVSDEQLAILYREALCYFFPSLYEGFGLPGLEALSHGLPVVAARAGALPEILGDAACYFDPNNKILISHILRRIENDEVFRSQLIQKGYKRISRFSWVCMALLTLRGYHGKECVNV